MPTANIKTVCRNKSAASISPQEFKRVGRGLLIFSIKRQLERTSSFSLKGRDGAVAGAGIPGATPFKRKEGGAKKAHQSLSELGCDVERSELPFGADPNAGAGPASSPGHRQLALKVEKGGNYVSENMTRKSTICRDNSADQCLARS